MLSAVNRHSLNQLVNRSDTALLGWSGTRRQLPRLAWRAATHGWPSGVYRSKAFPGLPPSLPFALDAAVLARLLDWPPM